MIYDRASRVLFVADGFGYHHADDETGLTSRQLPDGFRSKEIYTFHRDTLIWLRYADPTVLMGVLREMFAERDVSWVAPIHGNPIAAEHLDDYLERGRGGGAAHRAGRGDLSRATRPFVTGSQTHRGRAVPCLPGPPLSAILA